MPEIVKDKTGVKDATQMSRKEFLEVPLVPFGDPLPPCRGLVIIPENYNHESGFKAMQFVLLGDKFMPLCRIEGGSDVIDVEGIGGVGLGRDFEKYETGLGYCVEWSIDCLPKSRLLRLFINNHQHELIPGTPVSTFEVFSRRKKDV